MVETWTKVVGFDDYEISSWGRVANVVTKRTLALSKNQQGFYKISLMRPDGSRSTVQVNLLVAHHFLPGHTEIFNTPIHLDGNKENVSVDNLAWRPRWFAFKYRAQFDGHPPYIGQGSLTSRRKKSFPTLR